MSGKQIKAFDHNEASTKQRSIYVAADPLQPGTAYAGFVNDPKYADNIAQRIEEYEAEGAEIMLVTPEKALEMMAKWKHPEG